MIRGSSPSREIDEAVNQFCAKYNVNPSWVKALSQLCCATGKSPREAVREAITYYLSVRALRRKHRGVKKR